MKSFVSVAVVLALCLTVPSSAHHRNLKTSASIDYYLDSLVVKIGHFFSNNGLDPMGLPDMGKSFSVKDLVGITWHGELMLKEVNVSGLSMLHRSGESTLDYADKMLDIDVELGFDDVKLNCEYVAEIMNIGPKGKIEGEVRDLKIHLSIKFDVETFKIYLQDLKISDAGKISVKVHSIVPILDLLVDAIADVVTTIFHDIVVQVVAKQVKSVVEKALENIDIDCLINGGSDCIGGNSTTLYSPY